MCTKARKGCVTSKKRIRMRGKESKTKRRKGSEFIHSTSLPARRRKKPIRTRAYSSMRGPLHRRKRSRQARGIHRRPCRQRLCVIVFEVHLHRRRRHRVCAADVAKSRRRVRHVLVSRGPVDVGRLVVDGHFSDADQRRVRVLEVLVVVETAVDRRQRRVIRVLGERWVCGGWEADFGVGGPHALLLKTLVQLVGRRLGAVLLLLLVCILLE
ncbi:hypothetical protein DFJ73DRAFT_816961 [Zopfochytrium polystomum]|nr:hypothetical protein DFJ73DRAFT_816961 [Zopfochytrium polystomum]